MSIADSEHQVDIRAMVDIGGWLLRDGDAEGALQVYNDVLAAAPRNADALTGKGYALMALERYDQATRFLQRACEVESGRTDSWSALGSAALAAGDGEAALKAYARLQHMGVDAAENYLNMARAAYFALDLKRARDYVDLALAENPAIDGAAEWDQALSAIPDHAAFLIDVGRAHARRGRFERGLTLFLDSLKEQDTTDGHLYAGRALLSLGKASEAVAHLTAARDGNAQDTGLLSDLASALALSGDSAQAEQIFDQVLAANPEDTDALLGKAQLRAEAGDSPSAHALVDRLAGLAPDNPSVWFLQARMLAQDGRKVSARLAVERGIVRDTQSPIVWMAAADVMSTIGQDGLSSLCSARAKFAETGKTSLDVLTDTPSLPSMPAEMTELDGIELPDQRMAEALRNRVTVYANVGQVTRALEYLETLLRRYPDSETEELKRHHGSLLRKLGDAAGARIAFERARELDPTSERARLAIRRLEEFGA